MAGLVDCEKVWPLGYQGPWRYVAKLVTPAISPHLYDPKQLQTSYHAHVPVPKPGDHWPRPNEGDTWGNVNANFHMSSAKSTLKVPVPLPRSPDALFAELAEMTGGTPAPAAV